MYIFRFLVLLLLASICVPLAMHAQAVVGPIVKCPPQQSQPLWFKNPFLPPVASQRLPNRSDEFSFGDIIPPPEFRGAQQGDLIMIDANGVLLRVPLQFPCGFYVYPQAERSARSKNPQPESEF